MQKDYTQQCFKALSSAPPLLRQAYALGTTTLRVGLDLIIKEPDLSDHPYSRGSYFRAYLGTSIEVSIDYQIKYELNLTASS